MKVAILMGSESDWDIIRSAKETLDSFGIQNEAHVMSAHRSPDVVRDFTTNARSSGIGVIIAAAGGAAHLAGTIAAHTTLPVIGVPTSVGYGYRGGESALIAMLNSCVPGLLVTNIDNGFGAAAAAFTICSRMAKKREV